MIKRLRLRKKQTKLVTIIPLLLLLSFGALFYPIIANMLPHTLVDDMVTVHYNSQYDSTGTKDFGETQFSHNAPSGWSPQAYRVMLGQVTTYDSYTVEDKDQSYTPHSFEGNPLTDETTYYVRFNFSGGTTPIITKTIDPVYTDTLSFDTTTHTVDADFTGSFTQMEKSNNLNMLNGLDYEGSATAVGQDLADWNDGLKYKAKGNYVGTMHVYLRNYDDGLRIFGWRHGTSLGASALGSGSFYLSGYAEGWYSFDLNCAVTKDSWYYVTLYSDSGYINWYRSGSNTSNDIVRIINGAENNVYEWAFKLYGVAPIGSYVSQEINSGLSDPYWVSLTVDSNIGTIPVTINVYFDSRDVSSFTPNWNETTLIGVLSTASGTQADQELVIPESLELGQYARYKFDVIAGGNNANWIDNIDICRGSMDSIIDLSAYNDPAGVKINSLLLLITDGNISETLTIDDIELTGDWSAWIISDLTGNGNSGSAIISSSNWLAIDSTFGLTMNSALDDGDGFVISASNSNIGCTMQQIGLHINEAVATVDDFDIDASAEITYNGAGGSIVYEVPLEQTANGMSGSKTIIWAEDNYAGGDISDWSFTYDLESKVRDFVSCSAAGITVNGLALDSYTVSGGGIIIVDSDLDNTIEFGETGDEIPNNNIANSIFEVSIEGDYRITKHKDINLSDEELGQGEVRFTDTVTPNSAPTLNTFPVEIFFPSEVGDLGSISVYMKQPSDAELQKLTYLSDFTVTEGSTRIKIKRAVFDSSVWSSSQYEFLVTFRTDEDSYYELTNTEAEDLIGLRITGWEKYTDIIIKDSQNYYMMKGEIENVDVRTEFCFSIGQEIPNAYTGHIQKVEIWRYEKGSSGEYIFTNVYETTPNPEYTKFWSVYHISPKYKDYLMVYLDTPLMYLSKTYETLLETQSYKQIDVRVTAWETKVANVYMEIDLGKHSLLPQRYNYLIVEQRPDGSLGVIEGRVKDYKLYWNRDFMNSGEYYYTIYLQEKTTREKFEYLWLALTQQEIITAGVTLTGEEISTWEYPIIEVPTPEWRFPEIKMPTKIFPALKVEITPINWTAIGDRIVNLGRYAGGLTAIFSLFITIASLYIITSQLKQVSAAQKQQPTKVK